MTVVVEAEGLEVRDTSCVTLALALAEVVFVAPERTLRRLVSDGLLLQLPHTCPAAAIEVVPAGS